MKDIDLIRLLEKTSERLVEAEVVYVNDRLLDDLFEHRFGNVTKLMQSIERTSGHALKAEAGAGFGGLLSKLLLNLKANVSAEGRIGKQTKTVVEMQSTLQTKIALCTASLEDQGLIIDNPKSSAVIQGKLNQGKYLRLVDRLSTFTHGQDIKLAEKIGRNAASVVLERWQRHQSATPYSQQVALVTGEPFCMAAIVIVQKEVRGSTYILDPPSPPKQRSVLAKPDAEDNGVTFLKTFWVIDVV